VQVRKEYRPTIHNTEQQH